MRTLAKNSGVCMAICFIVLWMQSPGRVHAGGLFGQAAEHLTLTEYDDVQPIVKIQAARIFVDHEKYGFFRLGLVPLAVVQGVHVQLESAGRLTNALACLNSWNLSARNLRRLEVRDLELSLLGEPEPRLRAATARANAAGAWELSHVSLPDGLAGSISKATLQMTGPAAGRLRWRDGEKEAELFILKPLTATPQEHENNH